MLRVLYDPRYDPRPPDGNALPSGHSPAAQQQREQLTDAVIADTPRPLWGGAGDYADLVAERLRRMTLADRLDLELRLIEAGGSNFTSDYDPLKY